MRSNIKDAILQLLGQQDKEVIKFASVCLAAIGAQEIP